jgi:integrase
LFLSPRGRQLADTYFADVIRTLGVKVVSHGFRSTFSDWASENTNHPPHVTEMALAHSIPSAVEASYRRGNLLEKRKLMMADWAAFVAKTESGTVVPIKKKVKA